MDAITKQWYDACIKTLEQHEPKWKPTPQMSQAFPLFFVGAAYNPKTQRPFPQLRVNPKSWRGWKRRDETTDEKALLASCEASFGRLCLFYWWEDALIGTHIIQIENIRALAEPLGITTVKRKDGHFWRHAEGSPEYAKAVETLDTFKAQSAMLSDHVDLLAQLLVAGCMPEAMGARVELPSYLPELINNLAINNLP